MRKFIAVAVLVLLLAIGAGAQTTTVTGTVVDANGNAYFPGTVSAYIVLNTGQPTPAGVPTSGSIGPFATTTGGNFSVTVPSPFTWQFTVCGVPPSIGPRGNVTPNQICFTTNPIAISGGAQSITGNLPTIPALGPAAGGVACPGCAANQIPVAVSASALGPSSLSDNATTVSTSEPLVTTSSLSTGTSPPVCTPGTGGAGCFTEGTAATAVASVDDFHADSTQHAMMVNNNNTGEMSVSRVACVNITPVTVTANVSTDQTLMSCTLSANLLNVVGRTLKVWAAGVYSTPAASSSQMTLKAKLCTTSTACGATVIIPISIQSTALGAIQVTNDAWNMSAFLSTQTAGASSAYEAHGILSIDLAALSTAADSMFDDLNTATVGTIDSTGQLFLVITGAFSTASASNSMTERQLIVEVVN